MNEPEKWIINPKNKKVGIKINPNNKAHHFCILWRDISGRTVVAYTARKQIKLMPGFSATCLGGKTFVATIAAPRAYNYDGSAYIPSVESNSSAPAMVRKSNDNTGNNSESLLTDDQSIMENISICPNPCRGKLAISVDNSDLPIGYYITNLNGVVVHKDQITSNHQIIDISVLPKGVYFISLCLKD